MRPERDTRPTLGLATQPVDQGACVNNRSCDCVSSDFTPHRYRYRLTLALHLYTALTPTIPLVFQSRLLCLTALPRSRTYSELASHRRQKARQNCYFAARQSPAEAQLPVAPAIAPARRLCWKLVDFLVSRGPFPIQVAGDKEPPRNILSRLGVQIHGRLLALSLEILRWSESNRTNSSHDGDILSSP